MVCPMRVLLVLASTFIAGYLAWVSWNKQASVSSISTEDGEDAKDSQSSQTSEKVSSTDSCPVFSTVNETDCNLQGFICLSLVSSSGMLLLKGFDATKQLKNKEIKVSECFKGLPPYLIFSRENVGETFLR
jgi:hypothetical protein